jgi:hypothetical protein
MKNWAYLVIAVTSTAVPEVANAARFAVECAGVATMEDTVTEKPITSVDDLPPQTYVIDEERKQVQRALRPRQEFETWCAGAPGEQCSVSISPGLVLVSETSPGDRTTATSTLKLDRITGSGEYRMSLDWNDGRYHRLYWKMTCKPAEVPIFDRSRNRF